MERKTRFSSRPSLVTPAMPGKHRFIGRQAILDDKMELFGYELLFRAGKQNSFSGDPEDAAKHTIDSCLSMIACSSAENLFVNCTRAALVEMTVKLLPKERVVLEILETVPADVETIAACEHLKRAGFRLALDDFSADESKRPLVELADFIKIDFRLSNAAARQEIYSMSRKKGTVFLAEKVETRLDLETALAEGNALFQGYYHARPEIITETEIAANKSTYLQLFAALAEPSLDMKRIETLILMEPSLCFRLLRLSNSAIYGFRHRISTIQAALLAVGEDAFRRLVTVVLATMLSKSPPAAVDRDVEQALERAYFCESLATTLQEKPAELYMLGMLSMMDRLLNIPMRQLVCLIPVSSRIEEALLGSEKAMGGALQLCRFHELGGEWEEAAEKDAVSEGSAVFYYDALLAAGQALQALHV